MLDWGRHRKWSFAPFTVQDVGNPSYWDALLPVFVEVMADRVACVAVPAEGAAEMRDERGSTLDDPGNDTMPVPLDEDLSKAVDREKDLLDAMPLLGIPVDEAERRKGRSARAAGARGYPSTEQTLCAMLGGLDANAGCRRSVRIQTKTEQKCRKRDAHIKVIQNELKTQTPHDNEVVQDWDPATRVLWARWDGHVSKFYPTQKG